MSSAPTPAALREFGSGLQRLPGGGAAGGRGRTRFGARLYGGLGADDLELELARR